MENPLAKGSLLLALLDADRLLRLRRGVNVRFLVSGFLGDLAAKGRMHAAGEEELIIGSAVTASLRRTTTFIFFAMVGVCRCCLVCVVFFRALPSLPSDASLAMHTPERGSLLCKKQGGGNAQQSSTKTPTHNRKHEQEGSRLACGALFSFRLVYSLILVEISNDSLAPEYKVRAKGLLSSNGFRRSANPQLYWY